VKELGAILLEARTERGLSLEELSERTKIRVDYLQAVEQGKPEVIPGEVYYRAFVRSYAREVGLNADELLAQYEMRRMPLETAEERASLRQRRAVARRRRRLRIISFAAAAILLAGLAYWLWANGYIGNS
jgi:cytoskeletal protein RodZ